jgi:hypothetical protein
LFKYGLLMMVARSAPLLVLPNPDQLAILHGLSQHAAPAIPAHSTKEQRTHQTAKEL